MRKKLDTVLGVAALLGSWAKKLKEQGYLTIKDLQDTLSEFYKSVKGTELGDVKLIDISSKQEKEDTDSDRRPSSISED